MEDCGDFVAGQIAWQRHETPFPHITAQNVFDPQLYGEMAREFHQRLSRGLSEEPAHDAFMRMSAYDAYGISFGEATEGALGLFLSRAWHDRINKLFDIRGTGHVYAGAHHHQAGSKGGTVHTDFNAVWFPRAAPGRITVPNYQLCDYKTGAGPLDRDEKRRVYRAVAMIFYLNNDGWEEGMGGETGLYASKLDPPDAPAVRVAPRSNSVLLFECSPASCHAFLPNPGCERNSIILWTHRKRQDALSRWPREETEGWRRDTNVTQLRPRPD